MFAKLKQRIQEEGGDLKTDLFKKPGTNAIASHCSAASNQLETPAILDMQSNSVAEMPDGIVEDLRRHLKGQKEGEMLEVLLDRQQNIFKKSLVDKEKQYAVQIEKLKQEKNDLETETVMWKNIHFRDHEAAQEREGFQAHESSKMKDMLLKYRQDLQESERKHRQTEKDLKFSTDLYFTLENENDRFKHKNTILDEENVRLKENCTKQESELKDCKEAKDHLTRKVVELNWLLEENEKALSKVEKLYSTTQHDYETLKHNHELHVGRTEAMIKEKDAVIDTYEERIHILDCRLADTLLGDDERVEALIAERNNYEKKLEETRQHLNEIKSNWCEKIMSLEKQIVNLNQKMADDREESSKEEVILKSENHRLRILLTELLTAVEEVHDLCLIAPSSSFNHKEEAYEKQKEDLEVVFQKIDKIKADTCHLEMMKNPTVELCNLSHEPLKIAQQDQNPDALNSYCA